MSNFDFTQFISFDSIMPYEIILDSVKRIFSIMGFSIVEFENVEIVKKSYFSNYWRRYSFELQKDDFLDDFMDWETVENVPQSVEEFVKSINRLLRLDICDLRIIICSFAEEGLTQNDNVCIKKENIYEELFKMSPFSFICPYNLIIEIQWNKWCYMDFEKELEPLNDETMVFFKAVEEFETKGETQQRCPRCNGKLRYYRAGNSFAIYCENEKQCGFRDSFRGL